MRLITNLDPHQLRLGYLNCLVLVAGRQLDTFQGLGDRFASFIFREIHEDDPLWPQFIALADPDVLGRIKIASNPKAEAVRELFRMAPEATRSYPLHMLWLTQCRLAPHLGMVSTKDVPHILELARAFDLLTTGYALSEKGVLLQNYLNQVAPGIQNGSPEENPFDFTPRSTIRNFYLYTLLSVDVLTPFLLAQFATTPEGDPKNAPKLISRAAQRLFEFVEGSSDITSIGDVRTCRTLAERLSAKGVAKNQAQPRYHHLFELGLLRRLSTERGAVPYATCEAGLRATDVLQPLRENPQGQQDLIDRNFFRWASQIYDIPAQTCSDDRRQLLYFARGFPFLQREIGFTPGRTIAVMGCLLALEDGWIVEVADMFRLLQRMAAGPWRPYLEYSGGSRLDQEFLIKVRPGLIDALEGELAKES
jgi:hypothetical protein